MNNHKILILSSLMLILFSCGPKDPNQQIDEGKVEDQIYTSEEIGWTIEIPDGWTVTSKDLIEENERKGKEAIEQIQEGLDYSGLKNLISFQKDQFNMLQSTSEVFELEYEGEWEENNEAVKDLLYDIFANQGIKVDTASSKATIDGLDFEVFHTTVYAPDGNVVLYQEMYSRHINGFDFSVNINYNNEENRAEMWKALENSKFKKSS